MYSRIIYLCVTKAKNMIATVGYSIKILPVRYNKHRCVLITPLEEKIEFSIYYDEMGWYQGIGMCEEFQAPGFDNFCAQKTKANVARLIILHAERGDLYIYNIDSEKIVRKV